MTVSPTPEWGWMYVASTTPRNGCPEAAGTLAVPNGAKGNDGGAAAEAAETAEAMGCAGVPMKPKGGAGIGAVEPGGGAHEVP